MKYQTQFFHLAPRVPGVLYEPEIITEKARTAVLVIHSDEYYLNFIAGPQLASRGYRVLCANTPAKDGALYTLPQKLRDVSKVMQFLRDRPGIDRVVLLGHSGGATLLTAYQNVAENGPGVLQGPEKLYPLPEPAETFLPADGIMLLDANWGNAAMTLFSLDPAIIDERYGTLIDERLDLFQSANGFGPEGANYSREFLQAFQAAQSRRNNRIIDYALERLDLIERGKGYYTDDEPMILPGSSQGFLNNKIYAQDPRLMSHTVRVYPLLHADGTVTEEIVHSVRRPENLRPWTHSFREGARFLTVRTFLSSYAVRTEQDYGFDEARVWGVDWASSYATPLGNIPNIKVPLLAVGMTGGWEFLATESIYQTAGSADKEIAFVEGANHVFLPAKDCEAYPGQFGDTVKTLFDHTDRWLSKTGRFKASPHNYAFGA